MSTPRERVIAALDHRQPDMVPYHLDFTRPALEAMRRHTGDPRFPAGLGSCLHVLQTEPSSYWHEVRPGVWSDGFGVEWDRSVDRDIGNVANRLVTGDTLETFRFPDADDPARWEQYTSLAAEAGDRYVVANLGFSLFERAWTLAGMETLLMGMVESPGFVHRLLDRILEHNLAVIDRACSFPIDAMMFGDDWGQQRGLLMSPVHWREFVEPRVRSMYQAARGRGKRVFIHSCGKVEALFPDLIACGLDVFNPFQPEVMDVRAMKREFGERLSFFGGISTQRTLPYGTRAEVRDEVRRLLDDIGRGGGYIAAPAHAIPKDADPRNVEAMIEVLLEQ